MAAACGEARASSQPPAASTSSPPQTPTPRSPPPRTPSETLPLHPPPHNQLCIAANDAAAVPLACDFLGSVGRMKYVRPLYRALSRSRVGSQAALDTFAATKGRLHPIARKMVAADLGVDA